MQITLTEISWRIKLAAKPESPKTTQWMKPLKIRLNWMIPIQIKRKQIKKTPVNPNRTNRSMMIKKMKKPQLRRTKSEHSFSRKGREYLVNIVEA